ncbi:alpha/beta hydrolase [Ancylobacter amanitiformis]|uniref:Acetyl esterase/lipase n=1 Tax=Ancylobacter amanitiformis TaxID=217069 RepID=A0ABU0LRK8_9HYPH|nr:alpha/beta hydrolase [Ancylobacter amanitiformis]MDQ0511304.1 acetyl esterase/lipase [Ancylobacter amanitiformis]
MNRRNLLALLGAPLLGALATGTSRADAPASAPCRAPGRAPDAVLPLWPGTPPGGGGPRGAVASGPRDARRTIARPSLTLFHPDRPTDTVILIASGGGYRRIEDGNEALPAARWLAGRGIAAAVLDYRLPGEGWKAAAAAPLQDARRALRLIRAGASGTAPTRVGLLGFSAGAHLLALTAGAAPMGDYPPVDATDATVGSADFAAFIYPVLSLSPDLTPTSTQRLLAGRHPSPGEAARWSAETYVTPAFPPSFLVQAADDPVSDPRQAPLIARACEGAGVPVELHRLPSGGHGFGMGRPGTPSADWPRWYAAWLAHPATSHG